MKVRLSPSRIASFLDCPSRYLNEEGSPFTSTKYTELGTAAHELHELIVRWPDLTDVNRRAAMIHFGLPEDTQALTPEIRAAALKNRYVELCEKLGYVDFFKGFQEVREALKEFEAPPGWKLESAESKRVLQVAPGLEFSYIIDAAFERPGGWSLVDYKTSARPPESPLQLHLYIWAECLRTGRDPKDYSAAFYMTRSNKMVERQMDWTLDQMTAFVMEVADKIRMYRKSGEWPTTPSQKACFFCVRECDQRYGG